MLDTPRRCQAGPLFSCPSTLALPGLLGATNLVLPADSLVPPDTGFGHPIAPDLCKLHRTASTSGGREFIRALRSDELGEAECVLTLGKGEVERETGLEPATFSLEG